MADIEQIVATWADRSFHELPFTERNRVMAELDPDFAGLPIRRQNELLTQGYEKYYVKRLPPPGPEQIALARSGMPPVAGPQAPAIPMQEQSIAGALLPRFSGPPQARRPVPPPAQPPQAIPLAPAPAAPVPAAQAPTPVAAGPQGTQYGDVQILAEEPPPPPPNPAPIDLNRSGRYVPTPAGSPGPGFVVPKRLPTPDEMRAATPPIPAPQVQMREETGIDKNDPWIGEGVDPLTRTINTGALGAIGGLAQGTVGLAGGATQAAGAVLNSDTLRGAGRDMSMVANAMSPVPEQIQADPLDDPSVMLKPEWWSYALGQGLGSMAPMLATGMGAGKAIEAALQSGKLSPQIATALAKWGPSVVGGVTEGLTDAATTYDQALREGKSEQEALAMAAKVGASTSALSMLSLKEGILSDRIRSPKGKALVSGAFEAGTEGAQQASQNVITGRPVGEGVIQALAAGGLTGTVVGGALGEGDSVQPPEPKPAKERLVSGTFQTAGGNSVTVENVPQSYVDKLTGKGDVVDTTAEVVSEKAPETPSAPATEEQENPNDREDRQGLSGEVGGRQPESVEAQPDETASTPAAETGGSVQVDGQEVGVTPVGGAVPATVAENATVPEQVAGPPQAIAPAEDTPTPAPALLRRKGPPQARAAKPVSNDAAPLDTGGTINQEPSSGATAGQQATRTGSAGEGAPVRQSRRPGTPAVEGEGTGIRVPGRSRSYRAFYALRELSDTYPSHNPFTFDRNPDYHYLNDRDYADPVNQSRVISNSGPLFDPTYLITDNPDLTNGPSVIDSEGNVLGGNNRRMTLERVYGMNPAGAQAYRDLLQKKAAQFGINPAAVAAMKRPVLVRELVEADIDPQRAITDFNKPPTAALSTGEKALADSRSITPEIAKYIGSVLESHGPDATLNDVLGGKSGPSIVNRLIREGIFTEGERPALISSESGTVTPAAKDRIAKMLLGNLFADSDQFQRAQPALRNKLERIAPLLKQVESKPEWNLTPDVRQATALIEYEREYKAVHGFDADSQLAVNQSEMFGSPRPEVSPRARQLADFLRGNSPTAVAKRLRTYVEKSMETSMFSAPDPAEELSRMLGVEESAIMEPQEPAGPPPARKHPSSEAGFALLPVPEKKPESPKFTFENEEVQKRIDAAAAPPEQESTFDRAIQAIRGAFMSFARTYEHLPRKQYHRLIFELKQNEKSGAVASQTAVENVQRVLAGLDANQYDLFRYKVLFDDLRETYNHWKAEGSLPEGSSETFEMAFGVTPEVIEQELPRIDGAISADPKVQEAIERRREIWEQIRAEYIPAMEAAGENVDDRFKRQYYFRHRVLQHIVDRAQEKAAGTAKLRTPAGRGFLKRRSAEAAALDYSTDFITSEYEVMAQIIADTRKAQAIAWIRDGANGLNIADRLKEQAREQELEDWRELIPDTHTEWQPREGSFFYTGYTVPERIAQEIIERAGEELGITADDLRKAVMIGGKRPSLVLPKEVAATLDNLGSRQSSAIGKAVAALQGKWKEWQLVSPPRVVKYNLRNLSGDAEIVITGNPRAFRQVRTAAQDIVSYYRSLKDGNPKMSPAMQAWFERGGFQSTLQVQEIGDLRNIERLERLLAQHGHQRVGPPGSRLKTAPEKAWRYIFNKTRLVTDAREALLRYANFLEYAEQIGENGKPLNYGASKPEEVDALDDRFGKAYKLSNDLLGAYDEVSVAGQALRRYVIPFWSFQELNMRRYAQLIRNASRDQKLAGLVGRKLMGTAVLRSPYFAYRIGSFAIKAAGLWALLSAWNQWKFPEEERSLREDVRKRPHVVLGKHADGSVRYFSRLGNIPDIMEWFDPEDGADLIRDWLNGRATALEVAGRWLWYGPAEKAILGANPFAKVPFELAYGRSAYPSLERPRAIYDKAEYLADHFGLGDLYRHAFGKPVRSTPWGKALLNVASYEADPKQSAYYDILDLKADWQVKNEKGGQASGANSLKHDALRNMKLALRYGDKDAFAKYIAEYAAKGGTPQGLKQSIRFLHPLAGLKKQDEAKFRDSLNEEDRKRLALATEYYEETFAADRVGEFVLHAQPTIQKRLAATK